MCADLIFELLRLSTVKKCPHMLRSDHRGLRNSKVKLMWVGVVVVGGMQPITVTIAIACQFPSLLLVTRAMLQTG